MQVREELRIQEIHPPKEGNFKALLSSFSMCLRGFSRPEIKEDELEKRSAPQPIISASRTTLHALPDSKGLSCLMMTAMVCQQLGQGFFCVPCIHIANVQMLMQKLCLCLEFCFSPL
jgi:hypothetical protein